MSDTGVLQTLIVGHLWQSVVLAAVLAAVLILGRKMRGATRYTLAGAAFLASLALPLSAFIPGQTLSTVLLKNLGAPTSIVEKSEQAPTQVQAAAAPSSSSSLLQTISGKEGVPDWIADLSPATVNAIAPKGVPMSQTPIGKMAVDNGAPAWALNLGGNFLHAAVDPKPAPQDAPPPAEQKKPLFVLPEITLPTFNLPDLTLPLLMVWAAGALILLVRTGRDLLAVERLVARARPLDLPDALKRRMRGVRVAVSAAAPGPMAAGLFRPCVVLPESIALGSPGMAALLEHERAHIERRDMLAALAQRVLLALLWWSPALYWISRRIDEEREVACDEAAVERTGDPKAFARSLTSQAENQLWARAPRLAVGAIGPRSQFGRRIRRLIDLAKSGASPAKYSGRLAFAGLALAVATAAMLTPRFDASAQQTKNSPPPVDQTLAGGPIDLTSPQEARDRARQQAHDTAERARDLARAALDRSRDRDRDGDVDSDDEDYALLGEDIRSLLDEISVDLKDAFKGLSPDLENELNGLSSEMAALGAEISVAVNQQVMAELPEIMAQVREALEAEGIDVSDLDHIKLSDEDREQLRESLQEARDEIREQLGPELREEIRQAIEEARREIAEHRDEIAAAMEQSKAGMAIAREAMAKARVEIDAARARGDFDKYRNFDWKDFDWTDGKYKFKSKGGDFDFEQFDKIQKDVEAKLRAKGIDINGNPTIRVRGDRDDRLFRAAQRCDEKEVTRLIVDEKADVNRAIHGDGTPLIAAARAGCIETVRVLLNAGADVNGSSDGDGNPLIVAAARGKMNIVRLLLDRGADVNAGVVGDGNALIAAAQHGRADMVRLLLDRGAAVNGYVEGDETPLINAAEQGKLDVVKLLVERGAKVNLAYTVDTWRGRGKSTELRSPLNMAVRYHHDDVVAYLKSKGAIENPKPAN